MVALLAGCGQSLDVGDDLPSGVPVLGFDSMTSSYDETEGALEVTVYLSERSNEIVTFWFDFGGTATNGSDYHGIGGAGVLLPGVDFFTVPVTLLDDGIAEPAETIEMSVSKCVNCQLGLATHALTIRDNTLPRVTFDQPTSGAMESTPGTVSLSILPASPVAITVDYVVSGTASASDYGLRDGTLTIPAGATTASISIEHIDDSLDEDPEMVVVTLSNPSNAIIGLYATNTHTISDDDDEVTAAFFGPNDTVTEGNSGMQILTAEVRLDAVSGRTVSVPFGPGPSQFFSATLGVDYAIMTPSPLVFPPGTTSQTITFAILGDTIQDGSDTVGIELHSASAAFIGYPYVHSARIDNDECYATGAYRVCPDSAPTTDLTIDTTTFQNTSFDNSPVCASRQPPGWLEAGQPSSCFVVANNITIGTARFEGFRPVVLVALDSITINTLLDAGSRFYGSIGIAGPGHNPSGCAPTPTLGMGAGGAGGSFMTAGGNGGSHGPSAPGGIAAAASPAPAFLRGGCNGDEVWNDQGSDGGGAVYVVAGNTITIAPNATVNASGAGGYEGWNGIGGNGGGSGGMIVLWAPSIQASQAHLLANGGGGGEGADGYTQNAFPGGDVMFATPLTPAAGGSGSQGGDGGAGAVQGVGAVSGSNVSSSNGAGGGGGGLGYILAHSSLTGAISSPTPAMF